MAWQRQGLLALIVVTLGISHAVTAPPTRAKGAPIGSGPTSIADASSRGKGSGLQLTIDLIAPDGVRAARLNGPVASTLRPIKDLNRDGRDDLSRILDSCLQTVFGEPSYAGVTTLPALVSGTGDCGFVLGTSLVGQSNWCFAGTRSVIGLGGSVSALLRPYPFASCQFSSFHLRLDCGSGSQVQLMGDLNGDGVDDLWFGGASQNGGYFMPGNVTFGGCPCSSTSFCYGGPRIERAGGLSVNAYLLGDVNGDGPLDLAFTDGSSVYVLLGAEGVIRGTTNLTAEANFTVLRPGSVGVSLSAVAGGTDLNGDGLDDFAIGFGGADVAGISSAGLVVIVYGAADRSGVIDPSDSSAGVTAVLTGSVANERLGSRLVAIDDLSGDGRGDLLVARSGSVLPVLLGSADELPLGPTPFVGAPHWGLALPSGVLAENVSASGQFDFNGDGRRDLYLNAGGNSSWLVLDARIGDLFADGFEK